MESLPHLRAARRPFPAKSPANAVNNLRQNDAGIAARAHDGARRRFFGQNADIFAPVFLRNHAVHRAKSIEHIAPRIAVRHGKYIQPIDNLIFLLKHLIGAYQHIFESLSVNCRIHTAPSRHFARSKIAPTSPGPRYAARTELAVESVIGTSGNSALTSSINARPPSSFTTWTMPIRLSGAFSFK